jgi:hypothetical protein
MQWYTVPAGARPGECRDCKATVYWVFQDAQTMVAVNCDVKGGVRPLRFAHPDPDEKARAAGRGMAHVLDCPMAHHSRETA